MEMTMKMTMEMIGDPTEIGERDGHPLTQLVIASPHLIINTLLDAY